MPKYISFQKALATFLVFSIFSTAYLISFPLKINAAIETYGWTRTIGWNNIEVGRDIAADSQGNVYTVGEFVSTNVEFNTTGSGSSDIKSSNGTRDIFITKYNSDGSYGWTRTIGGTDEDSASSVTTDKYDNIYFTGSFSGTNINFNTTGSGGTDLKSSNGSNDIFITKYNSDGSYGWTRTMGGASWDRGEAITTDNEGNIYIGGFFRTANVDFNTTGEGAPDLKSSSSNSLDIFITKYNFDGSYGWTYTIGSFAADTAFAVATDSIGNVFLAGYFHGSDVEFNTTGSGSSDLKSSNGYGDIFITKYNSDGSYSWTRTMGGSIGHDICYGLAIDSVGNVYITGYFKGIDVEFNTTGSGSSDFHSSTGEGNIFITKYNSNGGYGWTRTMGGDIGGMLNEDTGYAIRTDNLDGSRLDNL